tara:strand:+ start:2541 stop:2672 length:132 start_codon:yes stop_codon:yes gene_type:complete
MFVAGIVIAVIGFFASIGLIAYALMVVAGDLQKQINEEEFGEF